MSNPFFDLISRIITGTKLKDDAIKHCEENILLCDQLGGIDHLCMLYISELCPIKKISISEELATELHVANLDYYEAFGHSFKLTESGLEVKNFIDFV